MINQYSLKADGNKRLSDNFKVSEFRCRDGSDKILIDDTGIKYLQTIRDFFNLPVYVRSGYRSPAYNDKIGGADGSNHITGRAWDIDIGTDADDLNYRLVCMYVESLIPRPGGIGLYQYANGDKWVHIDTGAKGSYWLATAANVPYQYFKTFLPIVRPMTSNWQFMFEAEIAQKMLKALGYYTGRIDGKYGMISSDAVTKFQIANKLQVDGILGQQTFKKLFQQIVNYQIIKGVQ